MVSLLRFILKEFALLNVECLFFVIFLKLKEEDDYRLTAALNFFVSLYIFAISIYLLYDYIQ